MPAGNKTSDRYITNVTQYVESHLKILQSRDTLNAYEGYYHNLIALKDILNEKFEIIPGRDTPALTDVMHRAASYWLAI